MERVICLAIGYVFGLFQTAFIYGKMNHIDIQGAWKWKCRHNKCITCAWEKSGTDRIFRRCF